MITHLSNYSYLLRAIGLWGYRYCDLCNALQEEDRCERCHYQTQRNEDVEYSRPYVEPYPDPVGDELRSMCQDNIRSSYFDRD